MKVKDIIDALRNENPQSEVFVTNNKSKFFAELCVTDKKRTNVKTINIETESGMNVVETGKLIIGQPLIKSLGTKIVWFCGNEDHSHDEEYKAIECFSKQRNAIVHKMQLKENELLNLSNQKKLIDLLPSVNYYKEIATLLGVSSNKARILYARLFSIYYSSINSPCLKFKSRVAGQPNLTPRECWPSLKRVKIDSEKWIKLLSPALEMKTKEAKKDLEAFKVLLAKFSF